MIKEYELNIKMSELTAAVLAYVKNHYKESIKGRMKTDNSLKVND